MNSDIVEMLRTPTGCNPPTEWELEAAAEIERLRAALAPFVADKMPSLRKSEISFNSDGLRCFMSPMQIAITAARAALSQREDK